MNLDFRGLIASLNRYASAKSVIPFDELDDLVSTAVYQLNNENPLVRPLDREGISGGLVLLDEELPTVIVPDIHARRDFMLNLLNYDYGDGPLLECLYKGSVQVVCVGDGFHTEKRGAQRWQQAYKEYSLGFKRHKQMDREMADSLGVMCMVMILKRSFPDLFHFLKGNHENIKNESNLSDRPFGKYAYEGAMVKEWVELFLGEDFLDTYSAFEQSLPVFVVGDRFLISHAEPRLFHDRQAIVNYRDDRSLVFDFSWTGNGESEPGTVEEMLKWYLPHVPGALYFGGHRPVKGLYTTRAQGKYIQIHNPDKEIIALIRPDRAIDPDQMVIEITQREA